MRPEFYHQQDKSREEAILGEALCVRHHVGLMDVSTLGKIYVQGPDAASFLEKIYSGRFVKQSIGKLRYGIACDETGVIIEDGIVVRLAEDRYYVTATSSGASAFFRSLFPISNFINLTNYSKTKRQAINSLFSSFSKCSFS